MWFEMLMMKIKGANERKSSRYCTQTKESHRWIVLFSRFHSSNGLNLLDGIVILQLEMNISSFWTYEFIKVREKKSKSTKWEKSMKLANIELFNECRLSKWKKRKKNNLKNVLYIWVVELLFHLKYNVLFSLRILVFAECFFSFFLFAAVFLLRRFEMLSQSFHTKWSLLMHWMN